MLDLLRPFTALPGSGNLLTVFVSLSATSAAYAYRIRVEDAMLVARFGASYQRYRGEVGALLPFKSLRPPS